MISETSRAVHIAKLAKAIGYVVESIDSTSVLHELSSFTDAPTSVDALRLTLCRLYNEIPNLQLKDTLSD